MNKKTIKKILYKFSTGIQTRLDLNRIGFGYSADENFVTAHVWFHADDTKKISLRCDYDAIANLSEEVENLFFDDIARTLVTNLALEELLCYEKASPKIGGTYVIPNIQGDSYTYTF